MSGFEVAAGAFAVVGVADVLVRAGRDLYTFLQDIEDAPNNAKRLCDVIAETVLLARASTRCLQQLETHTQAAPIVEVVNTLQVALKALNREVSSLRTLIDKYKGSSKRWSNIRYTLSEQRIKKALDSLERSKSSMTVALTAACRESTGIENQQVKELVQHAVNKTTDLAQTVNTRFDANERVFASQLEDFRQQDLVTKETRQLAFNAKLDTHHAELKTAQRNHQNTLEAIRSAQTSAASSQNQLSRVSLRTYRQTTHISRDVKGLTRASKQQHKETMDFLAANFESIAITQAHSLPKAANSGRQIVYFGEHRDDIVPAFYSIKKDLALVFDRMFTEHCQDVSPSHIVLLQSELQNLVASAVQEDAMSHPRSTATSFDAWIYPGLSKGSSKTAGEWVVSKSTTKHHEQAIILAPGKRRKRSHRPFTFYTSQGYFQVRLPRRRVARDITDGDEEISISFLPNAGIPFAAMNARFTLIRNQFTKPDICAHLQIMLPLDEEQFEYYRNVIRNGNIQEIDQAIRDGSISPYRCLEHVPGIDYMIYVAAAFGRADILSYLDSKGAGYITLRQEHSVSFGVAVLYEPDDPSSGKRLLDAVLGNSADSSALLADIIMAFLTITSYDRIWPALTKWLQKLDTSNHDMGLNVRKFNPMNLECNLETIADAVRFLLESGANPDAVLLGKPTCLESFMYSDLFEQCRSTSRGHRVRKQILSALIGSGANVFRKDGYQSTLSLCARVHCHWEPWCEALQENGMSIKDIVHQQNQEWLLDYEVVKDEESVRKWMRIDRSTHQESKEQPSNGDDSSNDRHTEIEHHAAERSKEAETS